MSEGNEYFARFSPCRVTTEIVQLNDEGQYALFRAEVELSNGDKATGWGFAREKVRGEWPNFVHQAEDIAVERAVARVHSIAPMIIAHTEKLRESDIENPA